MANENITPTLPEIEVLLAGNLAADDLLWIVRCSVAELHRMFEGPTAWVSALGSLPDWRYAGSGETAPAPVLTRDFGVIVETTDAVDESAWVTVQGISETNAITVLAGPGTAAKSALAMLDSGAGKDPLAAFWEDVARDDGNPPTLKKLFPVNAVKRLKRWYSHFELLDKGDDPVRRAQRTATFLLACVSDPVGYAAMLDGLDQRTLHVDGGDANEGARVRIVATKDPFPKAFYANVEGAPDGLTAQALDGPESDLICSSSDGPLTYDEVMDASGSPTGIFVKRWGVEDGSQ